MRDKLLMVVIVTIITWIIVGLFGWFLIDNAECSEPLRHYDVSADYADYLEEEADRLQIMEDYNPMPNADCEPDDSGLANRSPHPYLVDL